jgi:hypothetical protein
MAPAAFESGAGALCATAKTAENANAAVEAARNQVYFIPSPHSRPGGLNCIAPREISLPRQNAHQTAEGFRAVKGSPGATGPCEFWVVCT